MATCLGKPSEKVLERRQDEAKLGPSSSSSGVCRSYNAMVAGGDKLGGDDHGASVGFSKDFISSSSAVAAAAKKMKNTSPEVEPGSDSVLLNTNPHSSWALHTSISASPSSNSLVLQNIAAPEQLIGASSSAWEENSEINNSIIASYAPGTRPIGKWITTSYSSFSSAVENVNPGPIWTTSTNPLGNQAGVSSITTNVSDTRSADLLVAATADQPGSRHVADLGSARLDMQVEGKNGGDEAATAAWMDCVVRRFSDAMPGSSVEEILRTMSDTFSSSDPQPCSVLMEPGLNYLSSNMQIPVNYDDHSSKTASAWKRSRLELNGNSEQSEETVDEVECQRLSHRVRTAMAADKVSLESGYENASESVSQRDVRWTSQGLQGQNAIITPEIDSRENVQSMSMGFSQSDSTQSFTCAIKCDPNDIRSQVMSEENQNELGFLQSNGKRCNAPGVFDHLPFGSSYNECLQTPFQTTGTHIMASSIIHAQQDQVQFQGAFQTMDNMQRKLNMDQQQMTNSGLTKKDISGNCSEISDAQGLHLLALLLQCAESVSTDNIEEANAILPQLNELATPYGNSLQRVAAYFAQGMAARLLNSYLGVCSPLPDRPLVSNQNILSAFQTFNGICPFVKFSHFTSNQAILEAFDGESRVHIIDFDIMQGLQWPALFHILAARPGGCPYVRITGMGTSMDALEATGKRLSSFARTLRLPFEFHPVADKVGKLDPAVLRIRKGDALAVHWLHHSLYDVTGSDTRTLQLLQRLKPKVITMVEQDMSRVGSFLNRFVEGLHYYSAMFDSLGACFSEDNVDRHTVEQQLLYQEIKNILAVGGPARTGEIKFENWRTQLQNGGFRQLSMSGNAFAQAHLLLNMFPCQGYSLVEAEGGILKLGWKELPLYIASAWTS
eukprot:Gb_12802 [translate_table: standard]